MDDEIKKEAERIVNLFFKHSKGQTDDVRKLHAKMSALICIDEKIRALSYFNSAHIQIGYNEVKQYIIENY
jgi:hypothetical protein